MCLRRRLVLAARLFRDRVAPTPHLAQLLCARRWMCSSVPRRRYYPVSVVGDRERRLLLAFAAVLALTAYSSGNGSSSDIPAAPNATRPAIWVQASSSINPTALPLQNQHYVTDGPRPGYMYVCEPRMFQQANARGALQDGPWIHKAAGTYDVTKKLFVQGHVSSRNAKLTITATHELRVIKGNGLPLGVPTGIFPVQTSDPAYQYDRNPNRITPQGIRSRFPAIPRWRNRLHVLTKRLGSPSMESRSTALSTQPAAMSSHTRSRTPAPADHNPVVGITVTGLASACLISTRETRSSATRSTASASSAPMTRTARS
jgi:hypothetical protein